ncbi:MAG: pyruvate, water dikinase regulatory protein [Alphaproteobacteria bacterium]
MEKPEKISFHLHLVSDSTGETLNTVAKAVMGQFEIAQPQEHSYALVRTHRQLERVLSQIAAQPGMVFCTMVDVDLEKALLDQCATLNVPCVPVLDNSIAAVSAYLGTGASHRPGGQHSLDSEYFERIETLNYTMAHDDGQRLDTLEEADVVLVGVSRTSKTPTCIYLAHRGVKAANVPIVPEIAVPESVKTLKKPLVVGLTLNPDRLIQIRRNRLLALREGSETDYTDIETVKAEVKIARRLFAERGWPVIDVTRRSIEETAAAVLNLYQQKVDSE